MSLSMPLCSDCAPLQRRSYRLARAERWAQWTLGISLAVLGPLIWPASSLVWLLVLLTVATLVLAALATLQALAEGLPRPMASWSGEDLIVVSRAYAERLAEPMSLEVSRLHWWRWLWPKGVRVLALAGLTAGAFHVSHPRLRVVNLGAAEVQVFVSDQPLGVVRAVGYETPLEVGRYRVPVGPQVVVARSVDGADVLRSRVRVEAFREHLWIVGGAGYCLWLEHTGYGRSLGTRARGLIHRGPFWVLRDAIDTWFAPNPTPSQIDTRSSGGSLTALRYARCEDSPPQSTAIVARTIDAQ